MTNRLLSWQPMVCSSRFGSKNQVAIAFAFATISSLDSYSEILGRVDKKKDCDKLTLVIETLEIKMINPNISLYHKFSVKPMIISMAKIWSLSSRCHDLASMGFGRFQETIK